MRFTVLVIVVISSFQAMAIVELPNCSQLLSVQDQVELGRSAITEQWRNRNLLTRAWDRLRGNEPKESIVDIKLGELTEEMLESFDNIKIAGGLRGSFRNGIKGPSRKTIRQFSAEQLSRTGDILTASLPDVERPSYFLSESYKIKNDQTPVQLVRNPNPARTEFEALNASLVSEFSDLKTGDVVAIQQTRTEPIRYVRGPIIKNTDNALYVFDNRTRQLVRVSIKKIIGAKIDPSNSTIEMTADAALAGADSSFEAASTQRHRHRGPIWLNHESKHHKANMDKLAKGVAAIDGFGDRVFDSLTLLIADGKSYGVPGPHSLIVEDYGRVMKLKVTQEGIFIPELNILVPADQVLMLVGSAYPYFDRGN